MSCNGISHADKVFCLAVEVAELLAENAKKESEDITSRLKAALFVLTKTVTPEDQKRSRELMIEHLTKCDCIVCTTARESGLLDHIKESLAKMEQEQDTTGESFAV